MKPKTLRKYNEINPSKGEDLRISEYPMLNQCFRPEIRQAAQRYSESSQYSKPLIVFSCCAVNSRGHQPSRLLTTEIRPCYSVDVVGIVAAVGVVLVAVTDGTISPRAGQRRRLYRKLSGNPLRLSSVKSAWRH
jgi:hypothetical protein